VAKFIIDPDAKGITGQVALAVWVTREGQLEPVQATGGWLAKSQQKTMSKQGTTFETKTITRNIVKDSL
jgi:hypothetical protein